ncbi:unnamed protein product [Mytilus edulis]|uniref:SGNH hydrolase-type esterase domain-containing protein n=1 Tax=Mytilus edulis TaxID=6550 RepID=A0A8S3UL79_MYTED|nr:unnamed protein product [Mytilus edulis]
MKPQKRNRQPPNSLRSGAEKKATSKRKRPNVSNVHSDPERPMAPRGNQNIIAAGSHVAIPGPSSSRVLMSSTESLRPESHDVATTIHRRAADNDSSIVSQVGMVPSIQDSHESRQVWVMGSSIVYWAARSIKRRPGGQNLGLQSKGYNFHWYGQRGMKWKKLLPSVEENLRCYPPPQILIIHLGSNDFGLIKGKELIEQIRLDIMRLHVLLPNLSLVWSEILPRRYWHLAENQVAINSTRKRVNAAVCKIFKEELNHGLVICHPNIKAQERDLFRHDGVHLSDVGNDVFLNNVQGALESFASSDRRVFPN